jgi:capsular polysaccharide biosynthesis protein
LLGKGSWNYFHALLEFFPKLYLARKFIDKDTPILVDETYESYPSIQELIEILGFKNIIYVKHSEEIFVSKLYYLTSPFDVTFNKSTKFDLDDLEFSNILLDYINFIKRRLVTKNAISKKGYPQRIFLTRDNNKVRQYNNNEIEAVAKKLGFTFIDSSLLTLSEQYNIFNNASYIAGPTGASWTNLIFCKEHTKALIWMNENWGNFPIFSTISNLFSIDLEYIKTSNCDKDYHGSYYLDPKSFEKAIKAIIK